MKLKKWHVCLAIVCILCFGYIMYIMNPEFDDLKRFINPIYEGDKSYRVVNEENKDVTEAFIQDTRLSHTFKFYGKIKDYISDNNLTLSKDS